MKKLFAVLFVMVAGVGTLLADTPSWNEEGEIISVSDALMGSNNGEWLYEEKGYGSTTSSYPAKFMVLTSAKGKNVENMPDADLKPLSDDSEIMGTVAFKHTALNTTMATYACYRYSIPYQIAKLYTEYDEKGNVKKRMIYNYKVTEIVDEEISGSAFVNALVIPHTIERVPQNASLNFRNVDTVYVFSSIVKCESTRFFPYDTKVIVFENGVDSIPANLCAYNNKLHKVVLPEGLVSIGTDAFNGTQALKNIDFPNSLQYIGVRSFLKSGVTRIMIPENVKEIGQAAFWWCDDLDTIDFNAKNCVLGQTLYYEFSNKYDIWPSHIKSFIIGNKVDTIPAYLCDNLSVLTKIKIPINVKKIGYQAFNGCTSLEKVEIDDLSAWCKIQFSNNPLSEAHHLYLHGKEIRELVIPDDVEEINSYAFQSCNGLTSVNTNNTKNIHYEAFADCEGLTTITIGENLERMCNWICDGCKNLNTIYWNATDCSCDYQTISLGGEEFQSHVTKVIFGNEKMKKIPDGLCSSMVNLSSITIPSNIEEIGHYAFKNCRSLTNITLPNSISIIGSEAFNGCSKLEHIVIPDSVKRIEYATFKECSNLQEVTFGEGIKYVGDYAFEGCDTLSSVIWNAIDCPNLPSPIFYRHESYYDYELDENVTWLDYHSEITSVTFGNKVKHIPANLCYKMYNLGHVVIPESVESIGKNAFSYCDFLDVVIPNTVANVENEAFSGVPNVYYNGTLDSRRWEARSINGYVEDHWVYDSEQKTRLMACSMRIKGTVEIPQTVTKINTRAFSHCQISQVNIPINVTSIYERAFEDCTNLATISIPNTVTNIGDNIFAECKSLNTPVYTDKRFIFLPYAYEGSYTIPEGIERLCGCAFMGCKKLTEVVVPPTLTYVGYLAFSKCKTLSHIYAHPTTPPSTDSYSIGVLEETCTLYVPKQSVDLYKRADGWKKFINIRPINAQESMISDIIAAISDTSVIISWYRIDDAVAYEIEIRNATNNDTICTYLFDENGYIMEAHYKRSSGRQNKSLHSQKTNNGWQYTIEGLESDTEYEYTIIAKGSSGNVLDEKSGTFATYTKMIEAFNNVSTDSKTTKVLRDGQIFILRNNKTYSITGNEIQ